MSTHESDPKGELDVRADLRRRLLEHVDISDLTPSAPSSVFLPQGDWGPDASDDSALVATVAPGQSIAHYRVESFVARGGMGQVWRAQDTTLRTSVALKLVLPERVDAANLERFSREARAGGRLRHPNLVATLGHGEDSGYAWIAQEFVEGAWTLKHHLDEVHGEAVHGREYYQHAASFVASVADGLEASHSAGVIHRDVKPANILIAPDGTPRLTDFGLARISDETGLSVSGQVAGTWAYMSPEQAMGRGRALDHRTDVFSLGVVLYEMLTSHRPFDGDSSHQVAERILSHEPARPSTLRSHCPSELSIICGKAIEKAPAHRYASAGDFAADLRRYLNHQPILAQPPGRMTRMRKWVRRNPTVSATGLVAIAALVVVTLLLVKVARSAEIAEARAGDVLRLSTIQDVDGLLGEVEALWPPHPRQRGVMRDWIRRSGELLELLPGFVAKREELRGLTIPETEEDRRVSRETHPAWPRLQSLEAQIASRTAALRGWRGEAPVSVPDLSDLETAALPAGIDRAVILRRNRPESSFEDWQAMLSWCWSRVQPRRLIEGEEPFALALTLLIAPDAPLGAQQLFQETLVHGWALNGDLDSARAAAKVLEGMEPSVSREHMDNGLLEIGRLLQRLSTSEGVDEVAADVARMTQERERLVDEVAQRRHWEFPPGDSQSDWWHDQLSRLIDRLHQLDHDLMRAGVETDQYGWSVAKRLLFADELADRSGPDGDIGRAWAKVEAELLATYGGIAIPPAEDLMPLGPDPNSGLHEFAVVQSGTVPGRDPEGQLVLTPDSAIVLVLLPGGWFEMGAQRTQPDQDNFDPSAQDREFPAHAVELSPFYIGKHEVTQAQWVALGRENPSNYPFTMDMVTARHPVENITWFQAREQLHRAGLALPSEAQWEYAARAGTHTPWYTGADRDSLRGAANIADSAARRAGAAWDGIEDWPGLDDGHAIHAPVGSYLPNAFALHDMLGNVAEWCYDGYVTASYRAGRGLDPVNEEDGTEQENRGATRILRGGSFAKAAGEARVSSRNPFLPSRSLETVGVRAVRRL